MSAKLLALKSKWKSWTTRERNNSDSDSNETLTENTSGIDLFDLPSVVWRAHIARYLDAIDILNVAHTSSRSRQYICNAFPNLLLKPLWFVDTIWIYLNEASYLNMAPYSIRFSQRSHTQNVHRKLAMLPMIPEPRHLTLEVREKLKKSILSSDIYVGVIDYVSLLTEHITALRIEIIVSSHWDYVLLQEPLKAFIENFPDGTTELSIVILNGSFECVIDAMPFLDLILTKRWVTYRSEFECSNYYEEGLGCHESRIFLERIRAFLVAAEKRKEELVFRCLYNEIRMEVKDGPCLWPKLTIAPRGDDFSALLFTASVCGHEL